MSCCIRSSGWCVAAALGVAGIAGGFAASRALEARSVAAADAARAAVEAASFAQPEEEMSPDQMMAMMKELSQPVEGHKALEHLAGTWDCAAKFFMEGPEGPATETKGTSDMRLIMGGRYVVQVVKMDDFLGEPFEGMGFMGFDRAQGKYVSDWVDNWSTGIMSMTGEPDHEAKTMDWRGVFRMPGPDGPIEMPAHHVIRHLDDDHFVMEFWEADPATGEERKGGEISYSRRK